VDDGNGTASLTGDRREQSRQPRVEQLLGDQLTRHAADEPEHQHLMPERRRDSRDVHALAARPPTDPIDAMAPADPQFVDLVRHVQRKVERDGPDQSSHDPARITFCTVYSSSSSTRSARFPVSIEPTSYQPKCCAGVVDAIRDASTSDTP